MVERPINATSRKPSGIHYQSLDGLRGIAVIMVLLFHAGPDLGRWVHLGYTGVTLFFVLSGFLITGILIDSREAVNYFTSFYARRALRIFPIYYLTIICIFLIAPRFFPTARIPPEHDRLFYFLYLNNWTRLLQQPNNLEYTGHMWSLAVEEQFYWLWPLVIFKTSERALKWVCLATIVLGIGAGMYLSHAGASSDSVGRNTLVALPSLMLGALCAISFRHPPAVAHMKKRPGLFLFTGLALVAVFAITSRSRYAGSSIRWFSGMGLILAFAILVLSALLGPGVYKYLLAVAPLRRIGRYSYGMYVYHIPFYTFFDRSHFLSPGPLRAFVRILLVFVLAALSYELLEKRINALKDNFRVRFHRADIGLSADSLTGSVRRN